MVGTTEASKLLGICARRLRYLLAAGRVRNAFKVSNIWIIPIINGMPVITTCKRGPKPTWKQLRKQALSRIHVNTSLFGKKDKDGKYVPVITAKKSDDNSYCDRIIIQGSCSIVYDFDHPLDKARVWTAILILKRFCAISALTRFVKNCKTL
ncbi:DNA-binding protein [Brunnivagina elsteri]|uniref:DNA-binding protein n=1 Tax=Brunnivagina elsteri TaxID=1247191 RepID=UPI001B808BD1|nr:DNA-binding protein [Calothrix elsteri]